MSLPKMINIVARNSSRRTVNALSTFSTSHYHNSCKTNSVKLSLSQPITKNSPKAFSSEAHGSGTMGVATMHLSNRALAVMAPLWILAPSGIACDFLEFFMIPIVGAHTYIGVMDVMEDYVPKIDPSPSTLKYAGYAWAIVAGLTTFGLWKNTCCGTSPNNRDTVLRLWKKK